MVRLGRSGLDVFPLALGTNTFGWTADAETSQRILDAFVDAGGNLIDSADVYSIWVPGSSGGDSEAIIGQWLTATGARDTVLLTSKVSGHPQYPGLSAENIRSGIERTLGRMKTDYLDIYFAHNDDPATPLEESIAAFDELVRRGVVRQVGLSNFSGERVQQWIDIATATGAAVPTVLQPYYNLLTRHAFETELRTVVERNELGTMPYFGLGSAFLTGKYRKAADAEGVPRSQFMTAYLTDAGALLTSATLELTPEQTERLTRVSDAFGG